MKEFKDVQVDDWIFTIVCGWCKVLKVSEESIYPIKIAEDSYTYEGYTYTLHKHPSAWTYDPLNGTSPPVPEIDWSKVPINTEVVVRDKRNGIFCSKRKFLCYLQDAEDRKFMVFADGDSQGNAKGTSNWKYCELPNPPKKEWLKNYD